VNEKIRKTCNCPFIREKAAPEILCNYSLGTQKRKYESLFDRQVNEHWKSQFSEVMKDVVLQFNYYNLSIIVCAGEPGAPRQNV